MKQKRPTIPQKCALCGHKWDSRKPNPKSCPNCKRYDWQKPQAKETA